MYFVISMVLLAACGAALIWQTRQRCDAEKKRERLQIRLVDVGQQKNAVQTRLTQIEGEFAAYRRRAQADKQRMLGEIERWKNVAEISRQRGVAEVVNLMNYQGSEAGQIEITDG